MAESNEFNGAMPVSERLRFDVASLETWMAAHISGFVGPLSVEQFKGGQSNPSYRLTGGSGRYVLRRKPPGKLLPSAHAVDREYKVITTLSRTSVPMPKTFGLCMDGTVIGTAFYVMDYVDGRIFWDPALPEVAKADRRAIYSAMNEALARLHLVDPAAIGLADFGRPGNYLLRQIDRWTKQYRASETETIEAMDKLIEWLPRNVPENRETAIVHGDYRLDNIIFHPIEPRVIAILDWELSTIGDPVGDFAYHVMTWRLDRENGGGLGGIDFGECGIPTEEEYKMMYCSRTGRSDLPHWEFYMIYNLFRSAGIAQGIMGRVRDGTAANQRAVETGSRARRHAEAGWRLVEALEAASQNRYRVG